jgi:predicted dehydrogenase
VDDRGVLPSFYPLIRLAKSAVHVAAETARPTPVRAVDLLLVGAGDRGTGHAGWALDHPDRARVVAVAEPRAARRADLAARHAIQGADAVGDWRELAARPRFADAVLVCTLDRDHLEPVKAFAALGYHLMLEKPMAPNESDCRAIVDAVEGAGVMLAVGHALRYALYTEAVRAIVASGRIGRVLSLQHLEPAGRHDLDWIQYILGQAPSRVSSFGALREGPRGRHMHVRDNDDVDHQVVTMQFPDGATASFTMTGFDDQAAHSTRMFGTHGELLCEGGTVIVRDFATGARERVDPGNVGAPSPAGAHGGGDANLMQAFVTAVATGDPSPIRSGPRDSLASHLTVLAAERARLRGTVEPVPPTWI